MPTTLKKDKNLASNSLRILCPPLSSLHIVLNPVFQNKYTQQNYIHSINYGK